MNSERAERLVTALRARGVMAHVAEVGVYQFGVRVVIDWNIEALWDTDGAAGLDAQVLSDGMLVGFVPHIGGSEEFTEQQLVEAIATTSYSTEGLRPPTGTETVAGTETDTGTAGTTGTDAGGGVSKPDLPSDSPDAAPQPPPADRPPTPSDHRKPKGRWWRR
ncbi:MULTISPECIES: hypothetical protein [unclassified Streptomyces]|uniref:hypothetical protein n=1 Tax=unclassified Streptomyces TaxID=2593676 RepID=UPI002E15006B|nr:hypothetical protein OG452_32830 [Streptomyces sp. NBC_01197]WSS47513.1 hypothetical protein OG708_02015 [Streptomyces sp. NBC_01180]